MGDKEFEDFRFRIVAAVPAGATGVNRKSYRCMYDIR